MSLFPTQDQIIEGLQREIKNLKIEIAFYKKDIKALQELGVQIPDKLKEVTPCQKQGD